MSAKAAHAPMLAKIPDGPSSGDRAHSGPTRVDAGEGTLGPVPPPFPTDPTVRAELLARLDRGIAEARAGREIDWEELDRRTRRKHGLPAA